MKKLLLALSCAFLLGNAAVRSASADVFTFNFPGLDSPGTLTATPNGTPGQFLITGVTGTVGGAPLGPILAPGTFPTVFGVNSTNDNILYYPLSIPPIGNQTVPSYLDLRGVSFVLGGQDFNLYFGSFQTNAPVGYNLLSPDQATNTVLGPNALTISSRTVATTPEPSSLILLGTGVTGLAGLVRRRFARA